MLDPCRSLMLWVSRYRSRLLATSIVAMLVFAAFGLRTAPPLRATAEASVCTLADCSTSVQFHIVHLPSEARKAKVCAQKRCKIRRVRPAFGSRVISFSCSSNTPRRIKVSAALRDADGERLVRDARWVRLRHPVHPNGPHCPPTCYSADLQFDGQSGELTLKS